MGTPNEAKQIFLDVVANCAADEWSSRVAARCGNDEALQREVRALLEAHKRPDSLLMRVEDETAVHFPSTYAIELPGAVVGNYKLLQQIGEGGFGVVYMAEQTKPVQRIVALKIIKPGMDSRQIIARFEAERQALAMMDHPNIAKVLDAGTTDAGRPYFVMELVKGVPMTRFCDEHHLSLRERLELLLPVCHAVQHAHQKGIIHRDIKPSNVLVAEFDDEAVPKIIDFGVAKATAQKLTERTMFTEFGQVVGTVEYMSPEQAKFNQLDIDTRSDIYSLGVLLYELLTGTTPFERKRLKDAALDEVLRIIREEEPPRPSTKLSTIESLPSVAANRHTEPAQLCREVRGELDWIVMRSLEKDRQRRYQTASGLADDIEHYLQDQPVAACPPSPGYRVKKFIRRNRASVLAGSAIAAALLLGMTLAIAGFIRARNQAQIAAAEAAKAKVVSDLMQTALQSANPDQAKGTDYTVRQLLDDFSASLADQLAGDPEVEAEVRTIIANAYRRLGLLDLAGAQYEAALALCRRSDGPGQTKYAEILVDYAQNFAEQHRFTDAERTAREAVDIYRRAGITGRPLVKALWILQLQLAYRDAYTEEEAVVNEALAIANANHAEYPELANILHRHAPLVAARGDHEGGEKWARRAVEMHRRLHGNNHPETAYGLADLGRVLRYAGKLDEAETAFRESLTIFRRNYSDDSVAVRVVQRALNQLLDEKSSSAESPNNDEWSPEPDDPLPTQPNTNASRSLRLAQDALEREVRAALKSFESKRLTGNYHNSERLNYARTLRQVATIDERRDRVDSAIASYRKAIEITSRAQRDETLDTELVEEQARARLQLAELFAGASRIDECLGQVEALLSLCQDASVLSPKDDWVASLVLDTYARLAGVLPNCTQSTPELKERAHLQFDEATRLLDRVDSKTNADLHDEASRYEMLNAASKYIEAGQDLARSSEWNKEFRQVEKRLLALLDKLGTSPGNLVREQVGHKLRIWAFGLSRNGENHASVETALQRAKDVFLKLTIDFPDVPTSWHFLADTYKNLGSYYERRALSDAAEDAFRHAVEIFDKHDISTFGNDSERASAYFELASFLARTDRLPEATQIQKKGTGILAKSGDYNQLAWVLATSPIEAFRDPGRAVEFAKRAVDEAPQHGNVWNTLGVAQFRAADWNAAIRSLEKAMELRNGGDPTDWFFLAMAEWQRGQYERARHWFERSVTWMDKQRSNSDELLRFRAEAAELINNSKSPSPAMPKDSGEAESMPTDVKPEAD